jgi:hypothetical protein
LAGDLAAKILGREVNADTIPRQATAGTAFAPEEGEHKLESTTASFEPARNEEIQLIDMPTGTEPEPACSGEIGYCHHHCPVIPIPKWKRAMDSCRFRLQTSILSPCSPR